MLSAYRILSWIISPLVAGWLFWRISRGKEDRERLKERFGCAGLPRPKGRLIWLHAASVGEANSAMPLLQHLHDHYRDAYFLLTTGTVTSSRVISSRLPERAFHQFVPVDLPWAVTLFLRHWKPDMAIWVESELWPNLIRQTHVRRIPMSLINARLSDRSHRRWQKFREFFLSLASCFSFVYAGSEEDRRKLSNLGVKNVHYAGNLKFDAPPLSADSKITSEVLANVGDRRVWLAASTHYGEELLIARVHKIVKETFPELLTIIAPRHAHRGEDIVQQLSHEKLMISRRSRSQVILPETDIYVADTMGELGIFYRISGIVFVGGSLIPRGGHNPIEPAQLDCAVICGPHIYNFQGIARELMEEQALIQVQQAQELAEVVTDLLRDHDRQERHAQAGQKAVESRRGSINPISSDLFTLLPPSLPAGES